MKLLFLFLLTFHLYQTEILSQDTLSSTKTDSSKVNYIKLSLLSGVSLGGFIYGQIDQKEKYWADNSAFSIMPWKQEYNDALFADKFGHFFFGNAFSRTYKNALLLTGLDTNTSTLIACGLTFAYHTYVEVNDGFSSGKPYLGFSRLDWLADLMGVSFTYWQTKDPFVNKFRFKYSLQKSANFEKNNYGQLTDDYESTYHWLALDSREIFDTKYSWQKYINLAVGHSVKNLDRYGNGNHELYLSIDWNISEIETGIEIIDFIFKTIDNYHLPAPALKVYPDFRFYIFKY